MALNAQDVLALDFEGWDNCNARFLEETDRGNCSQIGPLLGSDPRVGLSRSENLTIRLPPNLRMIGRFDENDILQSAAVAARLPRGRFHCLRHGLHLLQIPKEVHGSLFFPITPGPRQLRMAARVDGKPATFIIDLTAISRLHGAKPPVAATPDRDPNDLRIVPATVFP